MKVINGIPSVNVDEVVLFPFDECSIPFNRDLLMTLVPGRKFPDEVDHGLNIVIDTRHPGGPILSQGKPGKPDSYNIVAPNVFFIEGEYRMWYIAEGNDRKRHICYAVSKDGFNWERPKLGLVEYNGSKQNNLVAGPCGEVMLYDPEDPDPSRRYKSLYMGAAMRVSVSYSADGLSWRFGPHDVFGIGCELGNLFKFNGCYYANGQGGPAPINRPIPHPIELASKRIMITYASYDFEHWTHAAALGFRRDNIPPRLPTDFEPHRGPQVHEGVGVWDRGTVLIGFYGQYDCPRNDRRYWSQDIGFVVSHDGIHWKEPVPDFKMIHSYEERDGAAEFLYQKIAFANIGDRTVYWYSVARTYPHQPTGVKIATWVRDRMGYFSPCRPPQGFGAAYEPHCISCPIELDPQARKVFVNVDGLGKYSQIKVELLDLQFRPIPGYSGDDCIPIAESGLCQPVAWREKEMLEKFDRPIRIRVNWEGIRPEDAELYAIYIYEGKNTKTFNC